MCRDVRQQQTRCLLNASSLSYTAQIGGDVGRNSTFLLSGFAVWVENYSPFFCLVFFQRGGKNKLKYSQSCKAKTNLVKKVVNKLLYLSKVRANKNIQPGFKF